MEKKNNIQEIIKDLTNKKEPIANQIKILFESVDKFKHKRHLIILSYLLGYYFSKGNNLFNKDILQNSLEIFEKSLTRKTDMANLMIAIALSLNKCNEVEKVPEQKEEKKNEQNEEKKNEQDDKKNKIVMDITETMLSTDPYKVYQDLFGETVMERPLTMVINNNNKINYANNVNKNINNKNINNKNAGNINNNKNINKNNAQTTVKNNKNIEQKKIANINENNNNKNYKNNKIGIDTNKIANTGNNNREVNNNNNNINNNNANVNVKEKEIILQHKYSNSSNGQKNNNENNNKKHYYNILDDDKINNNNFKHVNTENYENKTRTNKSPVQKRVENFVKGNFNTIDGNIGNTGNHSPIKFKPNAIINQNKPKKIVKCFICCENFNEFDKQNYKLNCHCIIHSNCFKKYIINSIKNKKIPILCPKCKAEIIPQIIYKCLNSIGDKNLISYYENSCLDLYINNYEKNNDLVYYLCPTPGCNNDVLCKNNDVKLVCSKCKKAYCIKCFRPWHNNKKCEEIYMDNSFVNASQLNKIPFQGQNKYKYKECPKCQTLMLKEEGKNKILCVCGTSFCYKCGKIVKEKHEC